MNPDIDPLIARIELISYLLKQYNLLRDTSAVIQNDLQVLNTFALAKDWDKVKLALDKWTEKLKDPNQVAVIICKWNISIEVAVDGSDIEFLKLLLPFVGKHKKLRIKLSYMAIALEKQDQTVVEMMLRHLHHDKDDSSILARLPKEDQRAYQALFNRYCCVSDNDIIKEILEDYKKTDVSKEEASIIAQEHRLAMITYLCHHSNITIAEDTVWNCINSGNIHISKLLEKLKEISVVGWMETFDSGENSSARMESGARPNTPLYHISNNKTPKTQAEDEQFNSLLALYSAYGGNISGIDLETKEKISVMNPPGSPRSLSGFLSRKGAPKRLRGASEIPSEAAVKIVQSKQDDYWTKYLCGEIQDISSLPWMEPSNDFNVKFDYSASEASLPQDPENAIFEGLAGLASRTNSVRRLSRDDSSLTNPQIITH